MLGEISLSESGRCAAASTWVGSSIWLQSATMRAESPTVFIGLCFRYEQNERKCFVSINIRADLIASKSIGDAGRLPPLSLLVSCLLGRGKTRSDVGD